MTDTVKLILAALTGSGAAVVAVILLVLRYPNNVQLWVAWLWKGARLLTRKAEYGYVAQDVSAQVNANYTAQLGKLIDGLPDPRISIAWNNDANAVATQVAGTIIVRMRPHEDRVRNILHAALAVTPQLVLPTLRTDLTVVQTEAIDLQLCRKFAETISSTAVTNYRMDLLEPALNRTNGLEVMLKRLESTDLAGLFVPVFLQELTKVAQANLAERIHSISDEFNSLLGFLVSVAEREQGEDVHLSFLGDSIRINIMLVAKAETRAKGISPYRFRVTTELAKGVDTVYVLATGPNITFAEQVADALDADRRLLKQRPKKLSIMRAGRRADALIVPFERNAGFASGDYFRDVVKNAGIKIGKRLMAVVTDVRDDYVALDVEGIPGIIRKPDLAWEWVTDCSAHVVIGEELEVRVVGIDLDGLEVQTSRKACLPNPISAGSVGKDLVGKQIMIRASGIARFASDRAPFLVGSDLQSAIPVRLPLSEYDWGEFLDDFPEGAVGSEFDVVVTRVSAEEGFLEGSRKRVVADKWSLVRANYPRGRKLLAKVERVDSSGAHCEVEPGLSGFVPADEFRQAGFEYADFSTSIRPGQDLHVVVRNVVSGVKERLTLGLQINAAR